MPSGRHGQTEETSITTEHTSRTISPVPYISRNAIAGARDILIRDFRRWGLQDLLQSLTSLVSMQSVRESVNPARTGGPGFQKCRLGGVPTQERNAIVRRSLIRPRPFGRNTPGPTTATPMVLTDASADSKGSKDRATGHKSAMNRRRRPSYSVHSSCKEYRWPV